MSGKSYLPIGTVIFATLFLLQGCGFHLRGAADLPASISPVQIQGLGEYDALRLELTQLLEGNSIDVVDKRAQASSQLRVSSSSSRRVLSVDGGGKVAEYELHESAKFTLVSAEGHKLVSEQSIDLIQTYLNTEDEILGKQQEESLLRKDMQRDLASRLLRRLQSQL
ncbi:LPS-assembly lipoprotein LptE [Candidatus Vondammii sp. HM_W22]|uniref:LPS-assembly lipoprotein LptE n=1 Tax=Candidatus Vondammii sp. HM_W22 TaxID=2687299 RepID=UPI001F12E90F|nr:LPS assembly lipoprotein LptE [Candidatus Vondammii sp. HM_W22]